MRALLFAIAHDDVSGPVNLTGPAPVTNAEFTAALGRAVNRPTPLLVPGLRAAHAARRIRRRGPARRAARDPGGAGARRLSVPPQHHRRGAGLRHAPNDVVAPSSVDSMAASIRSATTPIDVRRLGTVDYRAAWELQRELADARVGRRSGHPAAAGASVGVHRGQAHRAATSARSTARPVVDTDRGGKITWHGPGQLVGYPIIGLAEPLDVVNFVRRLEDSLIAVCAGLGLDTGRVEGRSGVWVPGRRRGRGPTARSPRSASGCRARPRCTASR